MNIISIKRGIVGIVALLCSSAGMAASVNVVSPVVGNVEVGSSFTITVHGDNFPTVAGATLQLNFSPAVEVTAIALAPGSPFTGGVVPTIPPGAFASGDLISVLGPLVGTLPSGSFDAFTVTFHAVTPGAANLLLVDDGNDICWSDAATFGCVAGVTYTQANVMVGTLIPVPAAVWLLGSALGILAAIRRRSVSR